MLSFIFFSLSLSLSSLSALLQAIASETLFPTERRNNTKHYHQWAHPRSLHAQTCPPPFHSLFIASRFGNQARVTLNPQAKWNWPSWQESRITTRWTVLRLSTTLDRYCYSCDILRFEYQMNFCRSKIEGEASTGIMMRRVDDPEKDRSVFGSGIGQGRTIGVHRPKFFPLFFWGNYRTGFFPVS